MMIIQMKTRLYAFCLAFMLITMVVGCEDGPVDARIITQELSTDPLDVLIRENFQEPYGVAVRYKYVDRYIEGDKRVVPTKRELVEPMLTFLQEFWIEPFIQVPNGEKFFKRYVPAEIVFVGSPIYNSDGTITLGTADAGARITLTQVNDIDIDNQDWVFLQLNTIYHEFAHIMHQNFNLPPNFQQISPQGYTSAGSWYTLDNIDALNRGFVSPYATSSFNEDFAETVAYILFDPDFYTKYTIDETCNGDADCLLRNEGRAKIRKKYSALLNHYTQYTGVDLLLVREIIQDKLN
jgi:substrate import-associated zinc metallohydrolase lipoprotein